MTTAIETGSNSSSVPLEQPRSASEILGILGKVTQQAQERLKLLTECTKFASLAEGEGCFAIFDNYNAKVSKLSSRQDIDSSEFCSTVDKIGNRLQELLNIRFQDVLSLATDVEKKLAGEIKISPENQQKYLGWFLQIDAESKILKLIDPTVANTESFETKKCLIADHLMRLGTEIKSDRLKESIRERIVYYDKKIKETGEKIGMADRTFVFYDDKIKAKIASEGKYCNYGFLTTYKEEAEAKVVELMQAVESFQEKKKQLEERLLEVRLEGFNR